MKICALQTRIEEKVALFPKVENLIAQAAKQEVDAICLPEKWTQYDLNDPHAIDFKTSEKFLSSMAKEHGVYVIGGAVIEQSEEGEFVTSYIFDRSGENIGKQRKVHLYLMEPKLYKRGRTFRTFQTDFGVVGVAVCFDLNAFPEVGRAFAQHGVDLMFNPVMVSDAGIENWHIYMKARTLENRMPICGVNPVGTSPFGNVIPGESIIIGFKKGHTTPAKLDVSIGKKNQEDVLIKEIDLKYAKKLRTARLSEMVPFEFE